ncbi:MAG: hypothetical protein ACR2PL_09330 [Dehalococcoidia bacterium]
MLDRFGRILRQHDHQPVTPPPATTPQTLAPGDALILQDGRDFLVQVAIDCQEDLEGRQSQWRWLLLDNNNLLEVLRHTMMLYGAPEILYQGTPPFVLLTGSAGQDGLLRIFEARVRAGTVATMPVTYEYNGISYQVRSTGVFAATFNGMTDAEVWADISQNPGDNVYCKLQAQDGSELLAVWTTHIALFSGSALAHADIKGMYSRT